MAPKTIRDDDEAPFDSPCGFDGPDSDEFDSRFNPTAPQRPDSRTAPVHPPILGS